MFERFTERARAVTARAQEIATERGSSVQTVDFVSALTEDQEGLAGRVLRELDVTTERIDSFNAGLPTDAGSRAHVEGTPARFSDDSRRVIELALREALSLGHNYIGTEHLLLGIVRGPGNGEYLLRQWGLDSETVRNAVLRSLTSRVKPTLREGVQQRTNTASNAPTRAAALIDVILTRMERDTAEGVEMHSATLANLAKALESLVAVANPSEQPLRRAA